MADKKPRSRQLRTPVPGKDRVQIRFTAPVWYFEELEAEAERLGIRRQEFMELLVRWKLGLLERRHLVLVAEKESNRARRRELLEKVADPREGLTFRELERPSNFPRVAEPAPERVKETAFWIWYCPTSLKPLYDAYIARRGLGYQQQGLWFMLTLREWLGLPPLT